MADFNPIIVDLYLVDDHLRHNSKYTLNLQVDNFNEIEIPAFFESKVPMDGRTKDVVRAFVPESKAFKLLEFSDGNWALFPGNTELTSETVSLISRMLIIIISRYKEDQK